MCSVIVAASENEVIGVRGQLPWYIPKDLAQFRRRTLGNVVIAGRETHDSIVASLGRALPGRHTIVLSRHADHSTAANVKVVASLPEAHDQALVESLRRGNDEYFIIGGASVYGQTLPRANKVYLTRVHVNVDGDASMPANWLYKFSLESTSGTVSQSGVEFTFETWVSK